MTKLEQIRLTAYSIANGGKPDLTQFTQDELKQLLAILQQIR